MSYKTDFMLDAFSARIAALEDEVRMLRANTTALFAASDTDGADIEDLKEEVEAMRGSKELPDVTRTYAPSNSPLMQQAQNNAASQAQMTYNQRNPAFAHTVWADYPQR